MWKHLWGLCPRGRVESGGKSLGKKDDVLAYDEVGKNALESSGMGILLHLCHEYLP